MSNSAQKKDRPHCPSCDSNYVLKNGSTHHKKPKFLCKTCGRQFLENPQKKFISSAVKETIKKLLLERISLTGIARSLGVSMSWLQKFVNDFYCSIPCQIRVSQETMVDLDLECDELWSFVNSKENPVYLWLAIERKTRRIVGVYLGNRSRKDAEEFWRSLPLVYQNNAQVYTDLWESYQQVIPSERHHPSTKRSGATTRIERFNNTLRQRCSRLVRKSLSFSRSLFNHEGAIFYFIHHYNEGLLLK